MNPQSKPTILALSIVAMVTVASAAMIIDKKSREANNKPTRSAARVEESLEPVRNESSPEVQLLTPTPIARTAVLHTQAPQHSTSSDLPSVKTISHLPKTEQEVIAAFDQAVSRSCQVLPAGNPLELSSFTPFVACGQTKRLGNALPPPSVRRHILSVGLDVSPQDQRNLPTLSGSMILSYLQQHFVSIQACVAKDSLTQALYLYPELYGATAKFQGASMTENIEQAVAESARNFRCLGLLVPPGTVAQPESLRTLVLVQKYVLASQERGASSQPRPIYELVFVRARQRNGRFELHPFVTFGSRRELHYLGDGRKPRQTGDCDIQATVFFSEYSHASQYPVKGVVRNSKVRSRQRFSLQTLEAFVRRQQPNGDVWDNITEILDAIIDGRVAG